MIEIDFTTKPKEPTHSYIINELGDKYLYDQKGLLHSYDDLPAVVLSNGSRCWYKHGVRYRNNDLPATITFDGTKVWYKDGFIVRIKSP